MTRYHHAVIAHGKAIAECLSERRPISDSKYRLTFNYPQEHSHEIRRSHPQPAR